MNDFGRDIDRGSCLPWALRYDASQSLMITRNLGWRIWGPSFEPGRLYHPCR